MSDTSINEVVQRSLEIDDLELAARWKDLLTWLEHKFERQTGIESALFLIGIQSRGQGYQPKLSKKAKQELIMEGTYCVFETLGIYRRVGTDEKSRIIWRKVNTFIPMLSLDEQEKLLKVAILAYFDKIRS